jgi:hypothetical protein
VYSEGGLDSIPVGDEDQVVAGPQREDTSQITRRKVVFPLMLIDDDLLGR